jgi:cysteine sulfinate desulfinase/cysteine desulfurase-like protein
MGADEQAALGAIRVSLGWNSRADDVDGFVETWGRIYVGQRAGAAAPAA